MSKNRRRPNKARDLPSDGSPETRPGSGQPSSRHLEPQTRVNTLPVSEARPSARIFGLPVTRAIEILIVAVAIPYFLYLGVKVTSLDSKVADAELPQLSKNVEVTKSRVDQLFDMLPTVRMAIAKERLDSPVHLAVVVTKPSDTQKPLLHIADTENDAVRTFELPGPIVKGSESEILLRGLVANLDEHATSFTSYNSLSAAANETGTPVPNFVDTSHSFALSSRPPDDILNRYLDAYAASVNIEPNVRSLKCNDLTVRTVPSCIATNRSYLLRAK